MTGAPAVVLVSRLRLNQQYTIQEYIDELKAYNVEDIHFINNLDQADRILSDQKRFPEAVAGPIGFVRNYLTPPTTTGSQESDTWNDVRTTINQRLGQKSVQLWGFSGMNDVTQQLVLKWERFGPSSRIDLVKDFSSLALDAVALSVLDWRLNSFYDPQPVPFMNDLREIVMASMKAMQADWTIQGQYEFKESVMLDRLNQVIREQALGPNKPDILNNVSLGPNEPNGEAQLRAISRHLAMFFISAVGLTSSLLSFTMYELIANESARTKIQAEVDKVLAGGACAASDLNKLPEITAALQEILRLYPPVPTLAAYALEDAEIGDEATIHKDSTILIDVRSMQRDDNTWGSDAHEFNPKRMEKVEFDDSGTIKDTRFQPFENSKKLYLGHSFIMMLAKLAIVSLFQRFDFKLANEAYQLKIEQRIGPKPVDLLVYALPRRLASSDSVPRPSPPSAGTAITSASASAPAPAPGTPENRAEQPIYILWGGRDGTCEHYAETLSRWAPAKGYKPIKAELNRYAGDDKLPTDGPVIIIAATYSGFPTKNAEIFHDYLRKVTHPDTAGANKAKFEHVTYGVFGCGRSGWTDTYQKVPIELDKMLADGGAERLIERGEFDAGKSITADAFDDWAAKVWEILSKRYDVVEDRSLYREVYETRVIGYADTRHRILNQTDTISAVVIENKTISKEDERAPARHLELLMEHDEACKYQPGDVISILPTNPLGVVERVFRHFRISWEQEFRVEKMTRSVFETLPAGERVKLFELLINYVELGKPAQKSHLRDLMEFTSNTDTRRELQCEINTNLANTIRDHTTLLDYLERYPDIKIPFNKFFVMLPHMRTREYSISSSPLWKPDTLTISYQIHDKGVSSGYLSQLLPGNVVRFTYRKSSHAHFSLPERPSDKTTSPGEVLEAESQPKPELKPVVMFSTGTGIAPFRAMIQDRWVRARRKEQVGRMVLYFGCRDPKKDFLYFDSDLKDWMNQDIGGGVKLLDVRPAFSRVTDEPSIALSAGCKYIQDRALKDSELLIKLYHEGARYLTCGNVAASKGLEKVAVTIIKAGYRIKGHPDEPTKEDIKALIGQVYFTDVFG